MLLHGFTGSAASWGDRLIAGLGAEGRRVIALDLPGHGRRDRDSAPVGLDATLALVTGAVDGPFDLVGYSMGARIALHCALRHPARVRRLVLESGSPGLASAEERAARREADEALADRIVAEGVEAFATRWAASEILRPGPRRAPADGLRVEGIRRTQRPAGLAAALRGLGTGEFPSLWDRLPELRQPTRLLVGALDGKFVTIAERMATLLPDAAIEIVPDAGHTVHLDRPDAWLAAVRGWLEASG